MKTKPTGQEALQAAQIIKAYCHSQKSCISCVFALSYDEEKQRTICAYKNTGLIPSTWPIQEEATVTLKWKYPSENKD